MKSIFSYVLTKKEKALLVFLAVAILGGLWYGGIYYPTRLRIEAADTTEIEDEMVIEQIRASKIQAMQKEINANREAGAPIVPSYNNFKQEAEELNRIFANAYDFDFQFAEPQEDGTTVRRNITVTFHADNYDAAVRMIAQVLDGPYRSMIQDINISSNSQVQAEHVDDVRIDRVTVSFLLTYYETSYDSDDVEGLTQRAQEIKASGGLAGADMSNLERSDLETAAEAVLGE